MRSVVMVCHPTSGYGHSSWATLALKETQARPATTIGVSGMPLNRDDVTVV